VGVVNVVGVREVRDAKIEALRNLSYVDEGAEAFVAINANFSW
jgi:hypothetical protein